MGSRTLNFVFDPNWAGIGSTVMRGFQLSGIARRHLGGSRKINYRPLSPKLSRSDLFLTKNACMALDASAAAALASRQNRLFADIVDGSPPAWAEEVGATIVTSSITSFEQVSLEYPALDVVLVNHHVDPRISVMAQQSDFRVGYFGEPFNAVTSDAIRRRVDFVEVATASQDQAWIESLSDYNVHYAIRQRIAQDAVKPFLKGFTAAQVGAVILTTANDPEAQRWLGSDYPYLVRTIDESSILRAIGEIEDDFGSAQWTHARDVMRGIASRVAPQRIARELQRALTGDR